MAVELLARSLKSDSVIKSGNVEGWTGRKTNNDAL